MASFEYSGRNSSGSRVTGTISAASADEVAAQLFNQSVTPLEIREVAQPSQSSRSSKSDTGKSAADSLNDLLARKTIDADELIMFSRQMFSLTKAGLPLDRAIKGLQMSVSNPMMKDVLGDVVDGWKTARVWRQRSGSTPKCSARCT